MEKSYTALTIIKAPLKGYYIKNQGPIGDYHEILAACSSLTEVTDFIERFIEQPKKGE